MRPQSDTPAKWRDAQHKPRQHARSIILVRVSTFLLFYIFAPTDAMSAAASLTLFAATALAHISASTRTCPHFARRDAITLLRGLGLTTVLAPSTTPADDETLPPRPPPPAIAYFSAGDPRFLQPALDEIKYLGVVRTTTGSLMNDAGDALPALRVE